ncbi:hypothetical protein EDB81DRAFT_760873 [Dactylonectria macrodidyma]|uniref:Uncharacterized protein n=1 Tax=Dactylonectria macrodidyma TaxID=307937 RepID=A0A9P9EPV6_9HYPO|nr:hypothetical protein EDB81DRAFT_760873 [Dactylonectria macrodidyma]
MVENGNVAQIVLLLGNFSSTLPQDHCVKGLLRLKRVIVLGILHGKKFSTLLKILPLESVRLSHMHGALPRVVPRIRGQSAFDKKLKVVGTVALLRFVRLSRAEIPLPHDPGPMKQDPRLKYELGAN